MRIARVDAWLFCGRLPGREFREGRRAGDPHWRAFSTAPRKWGRPPRRVRASAPACHAARCGRQLQPAEVGHSLPPASGCATPTLGLGRPCRAAGGSGSAGARQWQRTWRLPIGASAGVAALTPACAPFHSAPRRPVSHRRPCGLFADAEPDLGLAAGLPAPSSSRLPCGNPLSHVGGGATGPAQESAGRARQRRCRRNPGIHHAVREGRVTSMFNQGRCHPAIDLAGPLGTPVHATTRGSASPSRAGGAATATSS